MKMKKWISCALALVTAGALFTACGSSGNTSENLSGSISTNGSTSMEKVIQALAESYMQQHDGVDITYDPTGSGTGIKAAGDGTTDIGLSSRALKESETGLTSTTVALDGIAIIVNTKNPVKDLSIEQLKKIATGEVTNWSEVGGNNAPIVIIGREAGSGTRDGFESIVGVTDKVKYTQELTATGAVIAGVASNENAIGYASLAAVGDTVHTLSIDGVVPSEATVLDGTYKIQRPFLFVVKDGTELSAVAKDFIAFATSKDAADIIAKAGAVPVAK